MFDNMFKYKDDNYKDFRLIKEESSNYDSDSISLSEFMVKEDANMMFALLENLRYNYIGAREENYELITESTGDFIDKCVQFFSNLIKKEQEWFGKIFLSIQTLIGNTEAILAEGGSTLLQKDVSFTLSGNNYTIIDEAPLLKPITDMVAEYNKDISEGVKFKMDEINQKREKHISHLPDLRGEVLTSKKRIEGEDFKQKCGAFFRNGENAKDIIEIDRKYLAKIIKEYSTLKKNYSACVKQKRDLELKLESLKKYFENAKKNIKYNGSGDLSIKASQISLNDRSVSAIKGGASVSQTAEGDAYRILSRYLDYRYIQSKDLSIITLTVLESKCQAMREQLKMYDTIVRKWVTAKNGTHVEATPSDKQGDNSTSDQGDDD